MLTIFNFTTISSLAIMLISPLAKGEVGVTDTEVVVGAHVSESGRGAAGASFAKTIRAYFDDLNAKGGVHGRKVRWIGIDAQSLPQKTVEVTRTLVEKENIFAMVGGQSAAHLTVWKYLLDRGVPDLFFIDSWKGYFTPMNKSIFGPWYVAETDGYAQGQYVAKNMKGKKQCWLIFDSPEGVEQVEGAKKALSEYNASASEPDKVTIGSIERVDRMASQANSEVLKLKRAKCDSVSVILQGAVTAAVINFATNQAYNPIWLTYYPNVTEQMLKLGDKKALEKGFIATMPLAVADGMGAYNFKPYQELLEKSKIQPSGSAARGFFVAELFHESLRRVGKNLTRASLIKAIEGMNGYKCSLCVEPVSYSPTEHTGVKKPIFLTIKDGKWARVKE